MGRSGLPKCGRNIAPELPDDAMYTILSKLDFTSKVNAGKVCKKWDQLLKASSAGAKHWDVCYDVDFGSSIQTSTAGNNFSPLEHFETGIGRWIINRAGAIKSLQVSAILPDGQQGVAAVKLLERVLPLLAGCLSKHHNTMNLTFTDGSPFTSPVLSSSAFLPFLCPMVKRLDLFNMKAPITGGQFAAICKLSMLEELCIHSHPSQGEAQRGLQEMTEDISKLVNLTHLRFVYNSSLGCIPESISGLQKLNHIMITGSPIEEVPIGLSNLEKLAVLHFDDFGLLRPLRFPGSLQGLKRLASVSLTDCCLEAIPKALCAIPSLTSLDFKRNEFISRDGWLWWPTTLSRLTNLETLDISFCGILSLPPHTSGLRGLKVLHVDGNSLNSLPEELSCLQSLENLQTGYNCLATVPLSVLSALTSISTLNLSCQYPPGGQAFKVSSSLLPILHPGLVELDLRQEH